MRSLDRLGDCSHICQAALALQLACWLCRVPCCVCLVVRLSARSARVRRSIALLWPVLLSDVCAKSCLRPAATKEPGVRPAVTTRAVPSVGCCLKALTVFLCVALHCFLRRSSERAAAMRVVVFLLCALAADASASRFLSQEPAGSAKDAVLLEALRAGGCGKPCARVLQSAVDAISNKSAGTVHSCCAFVVVLPSLMRIHACVVPCCAGRVGEHLPAARCFSAPCVARCRLRGFLWSRADCYLPQVTWLPRNWNKVARLPSHSGSVAITVHLHAACVCASVRACLVVPSVCHSSHAGASLAAVAAHGERQVAVHVYLSAAFRCSLVRFAMRLRF